MEAFLEEVERSDESFTFHVKKECIEEAKSDLLTHGATIVSEESSIDKSDTLYIEATLPKDDPLIVGVPKPSWLINCFQQFDSEDPILQGLDGPIYNETDLYAIFDRFREAKKKYPTLALFFKSP
jgi:hypothetical protein